MKSQKSREAPQIERIPEAISSPQAKLIYLCLEATGGATVDDLEETLALKKIDILSVLNSLQGDGLVEQDGEEYVVA
ncbi:hypothetical protein [Halopiger goleimassiliensis]|uniref:hypothetical protein n=1 Tax=Halopiger goleimassiliensis TaxID=1293048 RepID=UPI0006780F0E|nr:hypothetical protein [Halopiger goleimassiliensis]